MSRLTVTRRISWSFVGILMLALAASGCNSWFQGDAAPYTQSCGNFTLQAASNTPPNFPVPQMQCTVYFSFDTQKCGAPACTCSRIAYVQMIRFIDQTDEHFGEMFQPSDEQEDRMVKDNANPAFNGWAVDRGEGFRRGYYWAYDDGTWDNPPKNPNFWHIDLGSNFKSAQLRDAIHSDRDSYRVDIVDVPVCVDPNSSCNGKILGYFGWMFARTNGADVLPPPSKYTAIWMRDAFDLAVAEWNKQDGKERLELQRFP